MNALETLSGEGKKRKGMIVINEELCKGCTLCVDVCPFHLIQITDHISSKGYYPARFADSERKCTGCTLCAIMCPDVAIEVHRKERTGVEP